MAVAAGFFFGVSNITVRQGQLQGQYDKLRGLFVGILVNNIINIIVLTGLLILPTAIPPLNIKALLFFAGGGILTSFLGRVLLFGSIEYIGPSRAGALKIISPIFTLMLGLFVLRERLSLLAFLGIALVFTGAFLCSREPNCQNKPLEESGRDNTCGAYKMGLVLAVLAGLSLSTGNVLRKLGVTHYGEPIIGVAIGSLVALAVMFVYFAWQKKLTDVVREVPCMLKGGGYLWTGVLTSLALYTTFTALLFSPVSIVNSIKSTEPLFTILASYVLLKKQEILSGKFVANAVVIVIGIVMIFIGA